MEDEDGTPSGADEEGQEDAEGEEVGYQGVQSEAEEDGGVEEDGDDEEAKSGKKQPWQGNMWVRVLNSMTARKSCGVELRKLYQRTLKPVALNEKTMDALTKQCSKKKGLRPTHKSLENLKKRATAKSDEK